VLIALAREPTAMLPVDWAAREVKFQASFGSVPEDWRVSLDLIRSGKVKMGPLLGGTDLIPLDGIQSAFEELVKPSTQL